MKLKTILITAVIVLAGSATLVSAQNSTRMDFSKEKRHQAKIGENENNLLTVQYLDVLNSERRKIGVKMYNDLGKNYYDKKFSKEGSLNVAINTAQIPEGNYTVEIYNKRELVCSKVIAKHADNEGKTVVHSLFAQANTAEAIPYQTLIGDNINNQVGIEYLDLIDKKEREIVVRIFKESGELLYNRSFTKKGKLDINYDTSEFPVGEYLFELYNAGELVCSKEVVIQTDNETKFFEAIAKNEK